MYRRQFITVASVMMGGMVHTRALAALLEGENQHLLTSPDFIDQVVDEFSPAQRQLVLKLVDMIIPASAEFPGAVDASVPKFVELMVAHWMTVEERDAFHSGLEQVDQMARLQQGRPFTECDGAQCVALLEALEARHSDHPWYQQGGVTSGAGEGPPLPFIAQLKELTVFGFFMSEVGCKQVLRYNPMPGHFEGDVPLGQDDSSWTPTPLM